MIGLAERRRRSAWPAPILRIMAGLRIARSRIDDDTDLAPIRVEDLVDHGQEGPDHGLPARLGHLITRRLGVGQDLGQSLVPDPVVAQDRTFRRAINQDFAPDLGPFVHVGMHPSPVCSSAEPKSLGAEPNRTGDTQVLPFSTVFSDAQVLPFSIMIYNPRREAA
jgi:hypothetical protein